MALPSERAHASPGGAARGAGPGIAIIAAVAANGVIGARGGMPWRLPEDLARFRTLTTGHAVIMGRRTWASLPKALPGRQNVVVTRQADFSAAGADVALSLEEALASVRMPAPAFCIGGAELYALALPSATRLYLTEIARAYDGDTWFPAFDPNAFVEVARETHRQAGPDSFEYAYVTYDRRA